MDSKNTKGWKAYYIWQKNSTLIKKQTNQSLKESRADSKFWRDTRNSDSVMENNQGFRKLSQKI